MKYLKKFEDVSEANAIGGGWGGINSPHVDYVAETDTSNFAMPETDTFTCSFDNFGYIENLTQGILNNEIWYTSTDENVITPYTASTSIFGANIVSNTYSNGKGVITFDSGVTMIGAKSFFGCTRLSHIIIPNSVESLGTGAFNNCTSLNNIILPASLVTIGNAAFQ